METITTLCFAAGISGGHIIPCISIAERVAQDKQARIIFFSGNTPLDRKIVNSSRLIDTRIELSLAGYTQWYQMPLLTCQLIKETIRSIFFLHRHKPERVISTGGIVAVPVCIAAWLIRIPIELYELNVQPGAAVSFLAPLATITNVCFRQTKIAHVAPERITLTPYPIRSSYVQRGKNFDDFKNKHHFTPNRITLFVQGGSQGSQFINTIIKQMLEDFPALALHIQIIHQTGNADTSAIAAWYHQRNIPAIVFAYEDNMLPFYNAADIVICRSGAGALFETLFFRKPCITIPLETASNAHQVDNALAMVQDYPELFTMLRQHELQKNREILYTAIQQKNIHKSYQNFDGIGIAHI